MRYRSNCHMRTATGATSRAEVRRLTKGDGAKGGTGGGGRGRGGRPALLAWLDHAGRLGPADEAGLAGSAGLAAGRLARPYPQPQPLCELSSEAAEREKASLADELAEERRRRREAERLLRVESKRLSVSTKAASTLQTKLSGWETWWQRLRLRGGRGLLRHLAELTKPPGPAPDRGWGGGQ